MTRLSVNLNKVALLRNQRDTGIPDLLETAKTVLEAGAGGITVHPRPDERHIRKSDVAALAGFLKDWPDPAIEFNIEGYPSADFIDLVCAQRCHQVTLVPDAPDQRTSDHGWDIASNMNMELLSDAVAKIHDSAKGDAPRKRVSLFLDPAQEPEQGSELVKDGIAPASRTLGLARQTGADRIELYTGPYACGSIGADRYAATALAARQAGLEVNAGHDLDLHNLPAFLRAIPFCTEVSIGHAITADALRLGWRGAVQAYLNVIDCAGTN